MKITPESVSAVKTTLKLGGPTGGLQSLTGVTATPDSTQYYDDKSRQMYERAANYYNRAINFYRSMGHSAESALDSFRNSGDLKIWEKMMDDINPSIEAKDRQANKGKPGYNENGYPLPQVAPKTTPAPASKPKTTQPTMKSVGKKLTGK